MTSGTLTVHLTGLSGDQTHIMGSLYAEPDALLEGVDGVLRQVRAIVRDAVAILRFDDLPAGHYAVVYQPEGAARQDLQFAALHFDGGDRSIALRPFAA